VLTDSEARHAKYSHEFEALLFSELSFEDKETKLAEILSAMEGVPVDGKAPEIEISESTTPAPESSGTSALRCTQHGV
jgi:hypothetical protein